MSLTSQPLGVSLPPQDSNAISVSMPDWEDVVGYEEGRSEVLNAMACGYPRFFRHPLVVELQTFVQNQIFHDDADQWDVMAVPTSDVADRLRRFLLDSNSDSVQNDEVSTHFVKNIVYVVRFPHRIGTTAKQFWQHSGEIVSSRHAEKLLQMLQNDDNLKVPAIGQTDSHLALKKRISGLYLPSEDSTKVALYPTGMAAIFATVRLLQKLRGTDCKSILVGFPYVDTLKILSRKEWCAQGVHFFPTCGEKEMKEAEAIVAKEKVLGIWTEFPSNPLLSMADLKRLAKCAHDNGTVLVVDDTVGSYNVNTMKHSCADLVATSLSKIFSGTGNVMGGSVVVNPEGPKAKELEAIFDAENDSFIVEDDVETLLVQSENLAERLAKTNATTAEIVQKLRKHPLVKEVFYPTLGDAKTLYDPFLNTSEEDNNPRYGPLFSILLPGGLEPARVFYNALKIAKGPSLGTNFTLSCPYTLLAHYGELDFVESCGVDRNLIRISIGQEDPEVIWADFEQAFAAASAFVN
ncbi:Cystathionine gamma-synthase [Phytophthora palmivora]|uniref:Cystathionine gamma-synthase n=1 Tax=Phytophthora palmivora TaxID=4796 RepID=A0A2P4XFK0_9STRA|nr:Cystathionine gamma-synthase [Phytophthora palmivora]